MTRRGLVTHPLVLRNVQVRRVADVTPSMRRITVGGPQLGSFEAAGRRQPEFASPAFDDHIKLIFAENAPVADVLPEQLPYGIEWTRTEHRLGRDYTPRRVDGEAQELDLDFVLGHDGPASRWANNAAPGDELWFVGPKSSTVLPEDLDWIVLLGDETALPAVTRFLEERPTAARVICHLFVRDATAEQPLAAGPEDTVTWHHRLDDAGLVEALQSLDLPPGEGYVWAAAESSALIPVRRYLTRDLGMPRDRLNITGYWHHHVSAQPASATAKATHVENVEPSAALPDLTEVTRWFTLRSAVQVGLIDALATPNTQTSARLGAALGVPVDRLELVLSALEEQQILQRDHDQWELTALGRTVVDDEHLREDFVGFEAHQTLALQALPDVLSRPGASAWELWFGTSLTQQSAEDPELQQEADEHAEQLHYVLDALFDQPWWSTVSHTGLLGFGTVPLQEIVRQRGLGGTVEILDRGAPSATSHRRYDVIVSSLSWSQSTDAELVASFPTWIGSADRFVILESLRPDALAPRPAALDLGRLVVTGAPPRRREDFEELAGRHGFALEAAVPLGWGFEALVLRAAEDQTPAG
ncbi:MAG: siderophore-interacting protein [Micrococcaceae bacterium]